MSELILRSKISQIAESLECKEPAGIILSGVIGSGKTTVASEVCRRLEKTGFDILRFDGDDVQFRAAIRANTRIFVEEIIQSGLQRPLIFVDEVQKEPEIFDAIKLAFDKKKASFIVTGSNPAFLHLQAQNRLQRRGTRVNLFPLSIPEIATHKNILANFEMQTFTNLLWETKNPLAESLPTLRKPPEMDGLTHLYLIKGGLPLAVKSPSIRRALSQIQLSVERGVTDTFHNTIAVADEVRRHLAFGNSQEFTYQSVHQKIRSTKRNIVDNVLDHLMNHGYIFKKRPYLEEFETSKSTYFANYSWVDPGMVSYFQGNIEPNEQELGFRLEGYIHTRLQEHLERIPLSSQIYYHKPFTLKSSADALTFKPGEIDFIVQIGERIIPIEVKSTMKLADIDTSLMRSYLKKYCRPFGIVLYGGSPHIDVEERIIYFPYWYV